MSGIDDRQRFRQRNLGLVIPNRFSHLPLNSISHTARLASFLLSARALERNSTVHDSPPSPSPRVSDPWFSGEKFPRFALASSPRVSHPRARPSNAPSSVSSRVLTPLPRAFARLGRSRASNRTTRTPPRREPHRRALVDSNARSRRDTDAPRASIDALGAPSRVSERFQSSIETAGVARGRMRGAMKSDVDASKSARDACARRDASRGDARGRTGTDGRR